MPEQLGVDRSFGDGTTIDRNVLSMFARTVLMNDLRKILLSDPALAGNQYGKIGGRYLKRYVDRPVERRTVADNPKSLLDLLYAFCHHDAVSFSV